MPINDNTTTSLERLEEGYPPPPPRPPTNGLPLGKGRLVFPPQMLEAFLTNISSRTYRWRFDEALRHSASNALAMRRDTFIRSLLLARKLPTAQMAWHLEAADEQDPKQKKAVDKLTKILQQMPQLVKMKMWLLECMWYGRSAVQIGYEWDYTTGEKRFLPRIWQPINGDKLIPRWAPGQWGVLVNVTAWEGSRDYTDHGMAHFLDSEERETMIIAQHEIEDADFFEGELAGRIQGVGLRDQIYWYWWLFDQYRAWLSDFFERVGLGGVWLGYFESGNDAARDAMQEVMENITIARRSLVPRPIGSEKQGNNIENVPPSLAGVEELMGMIQKLQDVMRELVLGQSLTSQAQATGLGSKVAELHADTMSRRLRFDAQNLDCTLTLDFVEVLRKFNCPDTPDNCIRHVTDADRPNPQEYMEGAKMAHEMGVDLDEDEVRSILGLKKPRKGGDIIKGVQQQPPGGGMPGGAPGMPPGGQQEDAGDLASLVAAKGGSEQPSEPGKGPNKEQEAKTNPSKSRFMAKRMTAVRR